MSSGMRFVPSRCWHCFAYCADQGRRERGRPAGAPCGGLPAGRHVRAGGAGIRPDGDMRRVLHRVR